jgi:hypothetical protein
VLEKSRARGAVEACSSVSHRRAVEPEHHPPVEIEPQRPAIRFTRRVRHRRPVRLTQYVVAYTIIWTISPQNAVPFGECGSRWQ